MSLAVQTQHGYVDVNEMVLNKVSIEKKGAVPGEGVISPSPGMDL